MTGNLALHDRNRAVTWRTQNAMQLASVTSRLRSHAARALREKGYVTTDGQSRRAYATLLRSIAQKIQRRQALGLGVAYWFNKATLILGMADRSNPS